MNLSFIGTIGGQDGPTAVLTSGGTGLPAIPPLSVAALTVLAIWLFRRGRKK